MNIDLAYWNLNKTYTSATHIHKKKEPIIKTN